MDSSPIIKHSFQKFRSISKPIKGFNLRKSCVFKKILTTIIWWKLIGWNIGAYLFLAWKMVQLDQILQKADYKA